MTSLLCAGALVMTVTACSGDDPSATASESSTTTSETSTTTTEAPDDGATTLATAEDVELDGFGPLHGQTLNIDAVEQDGEVTGELRVNDVVVTLQCANTIGDQISLGGEVTDNPDGQPLAVIDAVVDLPDVTVNDPGAEGELVAVIIREGDAELRDRVALWADDRAGSCTELVEPLSPGLDGGFFTSVAFGHDIETGGGNCDACDVHDSPTTTTEPAEGSSTIARAEDVELLGDALATTGGFGGRTLNISVAREADGEVTGEVRIDDLMVRVECANTDLDGVLILVGEITTDPTGMIAVGELLILYIREGDPDSIALSTSGAGSCTELFEAVTAEELIGVPLEYIDVDGNGNIETG